MLMLTAAAVDAVRDITASADIPDDAGLRIAANGSADHGSLELSITAAPAAYDEVFAEHGVRIFMDQEAAAMLDDKVLHAELDASGRTAFAIAPQQPGTVDV